MKYWMSKAVRNAQIGTDVAGWCCTTCHHEHRGHWAGFWWHKISNRHPFTRTTVKTVRRPSRWTYEFSIDQDDAS